MIRVEKQNRRRLTIATLIALLFHGAAFVGFQYLMPLAKDEIPEFSGQVTVTIGSSETIAPELTQDAEPSPQSAAAKALASLPEKETPSDEASRPIIVKPPAERGKGAEREREVKTAKLEPVEVKPRPEVKPRQGPVSTETNEPVEPVPLEQITDLKPAPVTPPAVDLPKLEAKGGEERPFEPQTEVEDTPLAVDLRKLDEAIAKTKDEPAGDARKGQAAGKIRDQDEGKAGGSAAVKPGTRETPKEGAGTGSGGAPLITWDRGAKERKLVSSGPPPDIPQWVKREGLDLKVVVSFGVTPEGQTTGVSTALSSGYPEVDSAVLDSVRKMRFNAVLGAEVAHGTISYIIRTK